MAQFLAQFLLTGLIAGAATALLFASIVTGSPLGLLLAQLAPLPILIAGLGWGHGVALLAAAVSTLALAASNIGFLFLVFLFAIGLPAWWLSYLTLLARPAAGTAGASDPGAPGPLEWYPAGRLVIWVGVLGAVTIAIGLVKAWSSDAGLEPTLKAGFEQFLRIQYQLPRNAPLVLPGVSDPHAFLDLLVLLIPPMAAATATATGALNLWLAGRIVSMSGRLRRPWTDFADLRLPRGAAVALIAAAAAAALPDLAGILARLLAAGLAVAHIILGFAVLHALTRPLQLRALVLVCAYMASLFLQWPLLLVLMLGLTDGVFDLRARFAGRGGPSRPPSA